jgi:catechol 2,3-dioxygenase-like lactoylglutathione lyase family enzyme
MSSRGKANCSWVLPWASRQVAGRAQVRNKRVFNGGFADDLVAHETRPFADPFQAPAWRAALAEPIPDRDHGTRSEWRYTMPEGSQPAYEIALAHFASSFLNIRVSDIHAVYAEWSARGAEFLTPPKQHETEIRCYLRDPDGYLIEVGQTTLPGGWRQFLNP